MSGVHAVLDLNILSVWVLIFARLFESSHFLLFASLSVEKLLFLFYPHSVKSCLLEASVQSVLNHENN